MHTVDELVLWESWEWRCVWSRSGELRLYHNTQLYVQSEVPDQQAAEEIGQLWRAAIESIRIQVR